MKTDPDSLEDIVDGAKFKSLSDKGWFKVGSNDFGIVAALDGTALFNRNYVQIWPVWGSLVNYSPAERWVSSH